MLKFQSEKKSISRKKEINTEYNEIPKINLNELEDKEMVLSYFENLSQEELNRLERKAKDFKEGVPDYETNKIKIKTTGDVVAEAEYDISDLLLDEKEDDFLANFTLDDLE